MRWLKYALAWLIIVVLLGAVGNYFFHIGFWTAAIIAGLALVANGLVAEWENRQPGGWSNLTGTGRKNDPQ
jgi:hypothetical protein